MALTTRTGPGRSGPEIRAALQEHAPDEVVAFETDFRASLRRAGETFDTAAVEEVLTRWWQVAAARAVSLSQTELAQVRSAGTPDAAGLLVQAEDGSFRRCG